MNCLFRISSSKRATGEDEIVSGYAIDHDPTLLARIERQPFEDFNHPADLHAFGQKTRERCASLGDGYVGTCDHLEFPPWNLPVRLALAYAADWMSFISAAFIAAPRSASVK